VLPAGGFKPLPGSQDEGRLCVALFRKFYRAEESACRLLGGTEATVEKVKAACVPPPRYLHLATHGYFESPERLLRLLAGRHLDGGLALEARPDETTSVPALAPLLHSGLALAGVNRAAADSALGEGLLTAEEVSSLDLRGSALAMLSACETGLGEAWAGQGMLGLQRSFQEAGARAVAASLWKVDDAATAVLMEEFYTQLWGKGIRVGEALRQAQLAVLHDVGRVERRRQQLRQELIKAGLSPSELAARGLGPEALPKAVAGAGPARSSPPAWWAAFILSSYPGE
jgi:CHAT domain-containing protein